MSKAQITEKENIELKIDDDEFQGIGPLCVWNRTVEKLTNIRRHEDVKPAYRLLVKMVNTKCYKNKLLNEPHLFI